MGLQPREKTDKNLPEGPNYCHLIEVINRSQKSLNKRGKSGNARKRPPRQSSKQTLAQRLGSSIRWLLSKKQAMLTMGLIGGATLGGFYGYRVLVQSDIFAISKIEVKGDRPERAESIQEQLASLLGRNSYRLRLKDIDKLVESDPWIKEAKTIRKRRDEIEVEVTTEQAKAAVQLRGLYLVNEDGKLFKRVRADDEALAGLTIISGIDRRSAVAHPKKTRKRIQRALSILETYGEKRSRPRLSEIRLSVDEGISVTTYDGASVIEFGRGEWETIKEQMTVFDQAWQSLPKSDQAEVRVMYVAKDASQVTVAFNEG